MKLRYRLFRKASGIYFIENRLTRQQKSLQTRDKESATRIFHAQNEAHEQPAINLQIARAYLMASDPLVVSRTWQHAMEEIVKTKHGSTQDRWMRGIKDKAFDLIRKTPLIETQAELLLNVLKQGTVSTNVHLRKIHNFCLDMNWLPWPVIPKRQWPAVRFKVKRAIKFTEHQAIITREQNRERKVFYQLCWFIGGSQGDIAQLMASDVDWEKSTLSFRRRKTNSAVVIQLGQESLNLLKDLPGTCPLFPYLSTVRAGDRATEFKQRCKGLGIEGVTLHSYRYAWAERAKFAGYPERFAMQALGHNSRAVHHAYAKGAEMSIPALEDYEHAKPKIIPT